MVISLRADQERLVGGLDRNDPLWARVSAASGRLMQRYVRHLADHRPSVYSLFAHEDELVVALADAIENDVELNLIGDSDLEAALAVLAQRRWLVATSMVNILPPPEPIELGPGRMLVPTWNPPANVVPRVRVALSSVDAMRRVFGGHSLNVGARMDRDIDDVAFDTRHTVSLVSIELGSRTLSRERAHAVGRFAVAVWTLLSPPTQDMYTPLWPAATEWLPGTHLHLESQMLLLEGESRPGRPRQRGMSLHYQPDAEAMYALPDDWRLAAPLRAVNAAGSSRVATSLLSAAWSLYLAARVPTDLHWLDRLVYIMQAREALCEPPNRNQAATVDKRWLAATERCRVLAGMRKLGFGSADLQSVRRRGRQLRNLGVHSADASLLSLGYPPDRTRRLDGANLPGVELAHAYIREGTAPAFHAVRLLAVEMWQRAVNNDFDDELHEAIFT